MKKEDVLKAINELGTCETMEDVRSKIVDLAKVVENDYTAHEVVVSDLDKAKNDITKLQQNNMDLYLKVTAQEKEEGAGKDHDPANQELTYENLFNEQGGLK